MAKVPLLSGSALAHRPWPDPGITRSFEGSRKKTNHLFEMITLTGAASTSFYGILQLAPGLILNLKG
jgi:hypothetical protein